MESPLIPALVAVLAVILFVMVWISHRRRTTPPRSVRPEPVLDGPVARLYRILVAGLPEHHVLAAVPFDAFLVPLTRGRGKVPPLAGHRADCLVCDTAFRVVAVVEVDRGEREAARDALLRDAALPVLRWPADGLPHAAEIRETIAELESLRVLSRSMPEAGH